MSKRRKNKGRKKRNLLRERKRRQYLRMKQLRKHPTRLWRERKKRRRKRDCNLGMPFIIAFQGDPTQLYYCADFPTSFELIPRTRKYPWNYNSPFARLKRYMKHHVTSLHKKVLIYKAG